ncbi:MAG: carbon-nitrogen hydrolase family protein [Syntrophaceae bacterium]|nr:carbon-nitrogen hydrolase family protein [Syntrophaceae bacterium]
MQDRYPKFKAAVVQTAPVFLNRNATIDKACQLILEAGKNGASLVAFPEVFVPGYPYWVWMDAPTSTGNWFKRLFNEAVEIPSMATDELCRAAKKANIYVVIGVTEKTSTTLGAMWNTNIIIDRRGGILGKCRKIMPTLAEKLVWGHGGDGDSFKVYDTDIGKLGTLICGTNANTLARFALIGQGEQVHVANYPAFPMPSTGQMEDWIKLRAKAHCHEGKLFTLISTSTMSPEMLDMLWDTADKKKLLGAETYAYSGIYGPDAQPIVEIVNEDGIVYAEIDIEDEILHKQFHDIVNQTTRADLLTLHINTDEDKSVKFYSRRNQSLIIPDDINLSGPNFLLSLSEYSNEIKKNTKLIRMLLKNIDQTNRRSK